MFKEKIKQIGEKNSKKKIENLVFLIIILIITILIINFILNENKGKTKKEDEDIKNTKILASNTKSISNEEDLKTGLEKILSTIKGVGDVNVFINYSESSSSKAMYDETTTTSKTEETDSSGGLRNVTSTEKQKEVIYSEENGDKKPVTEKIIMPNIEGAIITAKGASNGVVKSNIISAVQAATGLSIDKIQVFEMK